jgi:hypothetical protein
MECRFKRLFDETSDRTKLEQLRKEYGLQSLRLKAQEGKFLTEYWTRKARRVKLPVPQYGEVFLEDEHALEDWVVHFEIGHYLSPEALTKLSEAVREAQKARRERWGLLAAAVTGLIGAVSGLVSVLLHCWKS